MIRGSIFSTKKMIGGLIPIDCLEGGNPRGWKGEWVVGLLYPSQIFSPGGGFSGAEKTDWFPVPDSFVLIGSWFGLAETLKINWWRFPTVCRIWHKTWQWTGARGQRLCRGGGHVNWLTKISADSGGLALSTCGTGRHTLSHISNQGWPPGSIASRDEGYVYAAS